MTIPQQAAELRFPVDGGCFGCSRSNDAGLQLRFYRDGDRIVSAYAIPDEFHGAPDIAHGGIVATIFDEISCAAVVFLRERYVVTGELTVRYHAPCPVRTEIGFDSRIVDESHSRYAVVDAVARVGDLVVARSTGKFFYAVREQPAP